MPAFNIDRELNIKADLEETGEPGIIIRFRLADTWQDIQEVLAKAHDLPTRRPLHPEAYEYHLEALLPPGLQLHPLPPSPPPQPQDDAELGSGTEARSVGSSSAWGPRLLQVADESAWRRLQQLLPGSRAELANWQLRASASEAKSAAYVRHLEGYTGMWEVAVATSGASPLTTLAASNATANGILGSTNNGKAGLSAPDGLGPAVDGGGAVGGVGPGGELDGCRAPLDGVWSEEEVALLARCLAEFMRKGHLERVGAVAAGCCSLATLWWLLKQPNARIRPAATNKGPRLSPSEPAAGEPGSKQQQLAIQSPRVGTGNGEGAGLDSGHDPGALPGGMLTIGGPTMAPPSQQQQQPAAAFRLQLRKKDRGARPLAALDGRSGGGGGINTVSGAGTNSTLMAVLLSPNLLSNGGAGAGGSGYVGGVSRAVSLMMRDILTRVATTGPVLLRQYKGSQVALAAVWGVGLLSEMFRNPLLRDELMVAAQLGASQALAAAAGISAGAGGPLVTGIIGSPQKRRVTLAGGSSSGGGALAGAEGLRMAPNAVPTTAGPSAGAGGSNLGIDLEEVHWLLLSFAAFPEWLEARSAPPWDLQPMGRAHAATVIQSSMRGLVSRRQTKRLQSQVSRVFSSFRASTASPTPTRAPSAAIAALQPRGQSSIKHQSSTAAPTPSAQQPPRPAVAAPVPRPRGLSLKWEEELATMSASAIDAIDRYFDLTPGSHPGVVAAEALLALLVSGGPLAREHFAATVHPGQLVRMLDTTTVPPRVVHLGVVLLALALRPGLGAEAFFRGAGAAAVAAAPGPPGSALGPCFAASSDRTMLAAVGSGGLGLVLELLRWLAPLTVLEAHERRLRYGASERRTYQALRSSTRPYAPPPLVDWRWAGSGSEVAVHAASAAWALSGQLAKLWAAEAAAKKPGAHRTQQQSQPAAGSGWGATGAAAAAGGGSYSAGFGTGGGGAGGAASGAGMFSSSMPMSSAAMSAAAASAAAAHAAALATARAAAGPQNAFEEAAFRMMAMTVTCLVSGRIGPGTHLLVCGLVQLVSEPAAVPYMVRAGLVDAGQRLPDPPLPPPGFGTGTGATAMGNSSTLATAAGVMGVKQSPSLRRMLSKSAGSMARSQHSDEGGAAEGFGGTNAHGGEEEGKDVEVQARAATSLPGFAGVAPHPRGVVGLLMDSDVVGFLDIALSIIGLVAQQGTPYDPIKGEAPTSGIGVTGAAAAASWGPARPPAASGTAAAGGGVYDLHGAPMSYDEAGSIRFPVPDLDHADIPARRLLMAGGWGAVCSCLASAGGLSQTLPDMAAAALMFLAKEVYLWAEVLTAQAIRRVAAEEAAKAAAEAAPRRRHYRVRIAGPAATIATTMPSTSSGTGHGYQSASDSSTPRDHTRGNRNNESSAGDDEDPLGLDPELPCPAEVVALLRLLLGDDFRTLTAALQALTQLLGRLHARPLQYACLTAYHLAGLPVLRNPLGKAGIVAGLVGVMRRWYDLPPSEQRAFRATGEWAMAALVRLTAEPGGERNRYRLASSHRDESPAAAAAAGQGVNAVKGFFSGFGYATSYVPGVAPVKRTGRTGDELVRGMKWGGGWGWGSGAGAPAGSGAGAAKAAAKFAVPDDDDELARELVGNGAAPRSASDPIGLLVQLTSLRSRSRSSYVHIKMPSLLLLRQFAGERQYRVRLVTEGAGTALAAVANDSAYDGLTRAAAAALWMEVSQTLEGRDPLWWSAMVEQQEDRSELLLDDEIGFREVVTRIRNGAPADAGKGGAASGSAAPGTSAPVTPVGGGEPARLRALSRMIGSMLSSMEAEQQLVGARAAAGLLCEGDSAKSIFLAAGGMGALLAVASRPLVQPGVLAAVCTALLNLSSYVPSQIDMCQRCARLLLHINAKYTGYHGYLIAQRGLAAAAAEAAKAGAAANAEDDAGAGAQGAPSSRRRRSSSGGSVLSYGFGHGYSHSGVDVPNSPRRGRASSTSGCGSGGVCSSVTASDEVTLPSSIKLESLGAVEEIIYSTSGALHNLSRHPGNRDAFYRLELLVRTRGAVAELAAETAARPPPISGMSRQQAAAALLSGELRADMPLPSPPSRQGGLSGSGTRGRDNGGRSDSSGDDGGSDNDDGSGGGGGVATAMWSISSASPFVPYHLRDEVVRYVSYTSYLQEVLSRPLHAPTWGGGGGGDDSRSQASARTGGGSSSLYSSIGPGGSRASSKGMGRSASGEDNDVDRFWAGSVAGSGIAGGGDDGLGDGGDDDDVCSQQQQQQGDALGSGDPAFPRLATLGRHLSRPLTTMWAPLLVDRHDGVAVPLFGLRDAVNGERLESGAGTPGSNTRTQPGPGSGIALPWQQHHHQTHHFYSSQQQQQQQQPGLGTGPAGSVSGGLAASAAGGRSLAGGASGGAAASVTSATTTITHLPAPPSATRWSPAVRRLRPVGESGADGAGGPPEGAATSEAEVVTSAVTMAEPPHASELVDGTVTLRVEFEACGPHTTVTVVRNFRSTTTPRGCRMSSNGDSAGGTSEKAPATTMTPKFAARSGTAAITASEAGATMGAVSTSGTAPLSDASSATGLRRPGANTRPATAPTTRGTMLAAAGVEGSASALPPRNGAAKPGRIRSQQTSQPQSLGPVSSGGASSVSLGGGTGGRREGDGNSGGGGGSNAGAGCGDGVCVPAPAPSMVQQVASLVGSMDTSKADRLAREISFSLMSMPSSALPARSRSRTAGFSSAGGNALRQSVILRNAERSKRDVGTGRSRSLLSSAPSFSAASVLSVATSAASASAAPSAASAHASSAFGMDGGFENEECGARKKGNGDPGRFGCKTPAGQQQLKDFQAPRVAIWPAVPGSKISDGLYPTYRLETGEPVHIYRRRKDRVDELRPAGLPQSSAPDATAGSYQREEAAAHDLLAKAGEVPLEPDLPDLPEPPAPPRPDSSTLRDPRDFTSVIARVTVRPRPGCNISESDFMEDKSRSPRARALSRSLTRFGPQSLVSLPALPPGVVFPGAGEDDSRAPSRSPSGRSSLPSHSQPQSPRDWELEVDEEGEGRESVDRPGMELDIFDLDWSRSIVRPRLKHLVTRNCPGGPAQVEELRAFMREQYWWLLLIFHYYAALYAPDAADPFVLQPAAWAVLTEQTGLTADSVLQRERADQGPDLRAAEGAEEGEGTVAGGGKEGPEVVPGGRALSAAELGRMFTAAAAIGGSTAAATMGAGNSGGGRSAAGSTHKEGTKSGNQAALNRLQWIELLLRAAAAKFLQTTEPPSPVGPRAADRGGGGRGPSPVMSRNSSISPPRRQLSRSGTGTVSRGRAGTRAGAAATAAAAGPAANTGANTVSGGGNVVKDTAPGGGGDGGVAAGPMSPAPSPSTPPQLPPPALKTSTAAAGVRSAGAKSPRAAAAVSVASGGPLPGGEGDTARGNRITSRQPSVRWKLPERALDEDEDKRRKGGKVADPLERPGREMSAGERGGDGGGAEDEVGPGNDGDGDNEGLAPDLVSAVRRLLYECFLPNVAPGALVEPHNFRAARLCQPDVLQWFQQQGPLLKALYVHYRDLGPTPGSATSRSGAAIVPGAGQGGTERRRLELSSWLELVGEGRLLSAHFTVREARLAFMASRARYAEELAAAKGDIVNVARSCGLSYAAFLEALGRSAELISPPPPRELAKLGFMGEAAAAAYYAAARRDPAIMLPPRHSAQLHTPRSRPLVEKLKQVMSILLHNLMDLMGCKTGEQLLMKLRQPRAQPRARAPRPNRAAI
ncbi:hypothetical protein VaNZ11_001036 [Volvox africanus]|uniref:Uncharacterized protein n=1 Tax=Volvox africanus TaxID=51714 RepID=A0ABQ5RNR8_9CHLO|nr:hypothetical protein VaNZ11_001036 [Volvox africanus]